MDNTILDSSGTALHIEMWIEILEQPINGKTELKEI